MMRFAILLAFSTILSACATTSENIAAQEDATCLSYGAKRKSNAYVQCRMMLAEQRNQADAARSAALLDVGTTLLTGVRWR
jgi:hypothetical protein